MNHHPEALIIGSVMRSPDRRFALAAVRPDHFTSPARARAWHAVCSLADADDAAKLPRPVHADRIVGAFPDLDADALASLWKIGNHPIAHHDYVQQGDHVVARWQLRTMRRAYEDAITYLDQGLEDDDPRAGIDTAQGVVVRAEGASAAADPGRGVRTPQEQARDVGAMFEEFDRVGEMVTGARCGWPRWDETHGGARPGRVAFTIAPTGTGKTSLMLNLAAGICDARPGAEPVAGLYVNLEMMPEDVDHRLSSIRLGAIGKGWDLNDIKKGRMVPTYEREAAQERTSESGLHVTGPEPRDINSICAILGKHAIQHKIQYAVIDHLIEIRMSPEERRTYRGEAWRCHSAWVSRLGAVARRYGFALEIVGQCGRDDFDFKPGREPSFRNMQGGSALLNVVDTARILWTAKTLKRVVTISKNRGGRTGRIELDFNPFRGTWKEIGYFDAEASR